MNNIAVRSPLSPIFRESELGGAVEKRDLRRIRGRFSTALLSLYSALV